MITLVSPKADDILAKVLRLPESERLELADQILNSVKGPDDEALSPEWRVEIASRLQRLRNGTAVLHDWDDVERELLSIVGR